MKLLHSRPRWWILASVLVVVVGLGLAGSLAASLSAAAAEYVPGTTEGGRLTTDGGVPVLVLEGTPTAIGAASARLTGPTLKSLLRLVGLRLLVTRESRIATAVAGIPPEYQAEITAMAEELHLDPAALARANVIVDTHCSALVGPAREGRPLTIARNMDFFPAAALGPSTVVIVRRIPGQHAVAAVSWPGCVGVVSGMNDAGLTACILINRTAKPLTGGAPLAMAVRRILERCASVSDAAAALAAHPPASGHYVLLADALDATIVWQEPDGQHRDQPTDGWLAAANGRRTAGLPTDTRGVCLWSHCAPLRHHGPPPEEAWYRRALTATYMQGINAQAMVLVPATRTLELATGTGRHPAALNPWYRLALADVLTGGVAPPPEPLGRVPDPLPWGGDPDERLEPADDGR